MNIIDSEAKLAEIEQYGSSIRRSYVSPVDILVSQNESLCATIRQLWEQDRWIPVSERLPEMCHVIERDDVHYSCDVQAYSLDDGGRTIIASIGTYRKEIAAWSEQSGGRLSKVTHWRPLPAPPPETEEQP